MLFKILKFTTKEGGKWKTWTGAPNISATRLKKPQAFLNIKKKSLFIELNNRKVHSLLLQPLAGEQQDFNYRWDVYNKFTNSGLIL